MANTIERDVTERVCDFLAEREEQHLGVGDEVIDVGEHRLARRYQMLVDKMEQLHKENPELDRDALECMAVKDCLFDLETRFGIIQLFADSIANVVNDYVEELGLDVPAIVGHLQLCLWHLCRDMERFGDDAEGVRAMASALIDRN